MRLLLMSAAAAILTTACNQADPAANQSASATSAAASAASSERVLEARVNTGPGRGRESNEAIMHERHEGMEKIGDEFKSLRRQRWRKRSPDMASDRSSRRRTVDRLAANAHPTGSRRDRARRRQDHAKAEIWQKPKDFAAKDALSKGREVHSMPQQRAATWRDKVALGELGKTCKACHDPYRAEKGPLTRTADRSSRLGPSDPAFPLDTCRADRLQLVVRRRR